MAEAAGAADELAEDEVPEWVPAPAVGVAALDLGRLLPALLLHVVGEAAGIGRIGFQQFVIVGEKWGIEEGGGGGWLSGGGAAAG